ncbi:MAG: NAD(P)(+) transhydrogenase (Re/Si-specific) subunit alpha, partial [Deltaproteobacteria bacterium]|nr:NAD(P)(+) transhydrogenase (Re/Si-specific) subunit alpha [Deltaproteobacteria bacterium]
MKIGIPKEISAGEKRVAATPETSRWIKKLGFSMVIEAGAGVEASCVDDAYRA